ncbi:DUF4097 family beta strand repeat-containing protein [Oscillospiraceae bacterium PP1C4]
MEKKLGAKNWLIGIGIIVIGVIVIMGIFRTRAFAPTIEVNDEKSFSVDGITSLQVNMTKEQIRIIQTQTNDVRLHYHGTSKQNLKLSTEASNRTVIIGSTRTTNLMQEDLYMDIYLPKSYEAKLIIHTTSGNVTSEKIQAETMTINSTSGKIALNDCAGNLNLKASSGDISAAYNIFGKQDINITATSGSIRLQLPSTAEFSLEAKTSTGKLYSDFSVKGDSKTMTGQIGTNSNKVAVQTSTGSINLVKK